jgi:hypothetical protein
MLKDSPGELGLGKEVYSFLGREESPKITNN